MNILIEIALKASDCQFQIEKVFKTIEDSLEAAVKMLKV